MAYSIQTFSLTKPAFHVSVSWHSDKGEKYLTSCPAHHSFSLLLCQMMTARHQLLVSVWLHVLEASITDQFLVTCAFICSIVSHKLITVGGTVREIRAHKKHHVCDERERELCWAVVGWGRRTKKAGKVVRRDWGVQSQSHQCGWRRLQGTMAVLLCLCVFFQVLNVQTAGYSAAIIHNYEGNDSIMPMSGDSKCKSERVDGSHKCCQSLGALSIERTAVVVFDTFLGLWHQWSEETKQFMSSGLLTDL